MTKDPEQSAPNTTSKGSFDYGSHFGTMRVLGDILRTEDRRPWLTSLPKEAGPHKHAIWMGCHVLRVPHLAESLDDILVHLKEDYVSLGGPSNCCGIVHEANGDVAVSKNMLKQTLGKLEAFSPDRMLYWCPSCDSQVRQSPDKHSDLVDARTSVVHFLAEAIDRMQLKPVTPIRLALHTHGGFAEQDDDAAAAKRLLTTVPGVEVIDMPPITRERHCTDAGIRDFGKDNYSRSLNEWTAIARTQGATAVASIYHSCHRQILLAQRAWTSDERLPVINYLTVLSRSLGLPDREDMFARCTQTERIEDMLASVQSDLPARRVSPEQATRALKNQFGA
jgi:Fe-S oxidoreductase